MHLGSRGLVRPLALPVRQSHRRISSSVRVTALLNKIGHKNKDASDEAVVIPLNYAQLLGLRGRDLYLDPQITNAHDELFAADLDPYYTSVARLGKEKLLYAAREGLRAARGRTSLIHPDIAVEPVLLPGAMALLEQAGQYELVIQLAAQAKNVTPRDLRPNNRATMKDYERDVTFATALAHCGLAKKELESGHPAMGCARLEEALYLLRETNLGSPSLAPELQQNIISALSDLKADAVLDYLSQPLELAEVALRKQALAALGGMLMQRQGHKHSAVDTTYVKKALDTLTAEEISNLLDWKKVTSRPNVSNFSWFDPDLLPKIGLAHIVTGFASRRPELINTAVAVLRAARAQHAHLDVAIHLAVCEVLLGAPMAALDLLKEDEKHGLHLRNQSGVPSPGHRARSPYSSAAAAASLAFPERDGVMAFIRATSPEGDADLLPGLCLFVEQWLQRLAFPQLRDTNERPPLASLAVYFEDPRTESYLESRDRGLLSLHPLIESVSTAAASVASVPAQLLKSVLEHKQLKYVAAAIAVFVALSVTGQKIAATKRTQSAQAPGGAAAAARGTAPKAATTTKQQTQKVSKQKMLSKETASSLVKAWLDIKAEAMGPRHKIVGLKAVLAEPMLGAVTNEAREAASSGWFWNIRPLRSRIDSIDESNLTPEGGYAVVVATVDESADLWATNGKKGDSYKSEYRVEYTMVRAAGGWKIASALVLGR